MKFCLEQRMTSCVRRSHGGPHVDGPPYTGDGPESPGYYAGLGRTIGWD
ncbi:MAG: hypothetical protein AAF226_10355 [Verrucomicrobiota bacterium]